MRDAAPIQIPPRTRTRVRTIRAADLFCGAGGTSTGLARACAALNHRLELTAVNHWEVAIETHSANHPDARHLCTAIDAVDPRKVVPGGHLNLLVASPECTHHSRARGGKPMSDQRRAGAWHVLHWANHLQIDNILIENVREFMDWGPLDNKGRPIQRLKGQLFVQWVESLRASNYAVDWRILNAADYGDATTRERLFVIARRGRKKIVWPEPTHRRHAAADLLAESAPWRPAREIIDWSLPSQSIFDRKRPLAPSTMARIEAGLKKFGGAAAEPFLVILRGGGNKGAGGARSIDKPLPTLTTSGAHIGVAQPFVLPVNHGAGDLRTHAIDAPMPTVTTVDAWGLCEPFILPHRTFQNMSVDSVDNPLRTITAHSSDFALCEPFLVSYYGKSSADPVSEPLNTVTTKDRFGLVLPNGTPAQLDILFRMLQPRELAAAMGFPSDYRFAGKREDVVKQIGNAVCVNLAAALCRTILGGEA